MSRLLTQRLYEATQRTGEQRLHDLYRRVRDDKLSARCQGYGRFALPCQNRVTVSDDGYALCHHHTSQRGFLRPLVSPEEL